MGDDQIYGYYSERARAMGEPVEAYLSMGGAEVWCTGVGRARNPQDGGYAWPDARCVGIVEERLRDVMGREFEYGAETGRMPWYVER